MNWKPCDEWGRPSSNSTTANVNFSPTVNNDCGNDDALLCPIRRETILIDEEDDSSGWSLQDGEDGKDGKDGGEVEAATAIAEKPKEFLYKSGQKMANCSVEVPKNGILIAM